MEEKNQIEESIVDLEKKNLSRKKFLKLAGLGVAALAISALPKKARADNEKKGLEKYRFAMVIDVRRCVGCHSCSIACKVENNVPINLERDDRKIFWNDVSFKEEGEYPYVRKKITNRPCMHCEHPPCVKVCPTGASFKNADGVVLVDYDVCIGCRYCAVSCPYGARYFNWSKPTWYSERREEAFNPDVQKRIKGVIEKCVFCIHRIEKAIQQADRKHRDLEDNDLVNLPACVQTCMGRARFFGDLNDPNSTVSKLVRSGRAFRLLEELGNEPNVFYLKEA